MSDRFGAGPACLSSDPHGLLILWSNFGNEDCLTTLYKHLKLSSDWENVHKISINISTNEDPFDRLPTVVTPSLALPFATTQMVAGGVGGVLAGSSRILG